MAGLDPTIHVLGTDMDAPIKSGHDGHIGVSASGSRSPELILPP